MRGVPRARGSGRLTARTPEPRGRTPPARRSVVWLLVLALGLLAACTGDDDDAAGGNGDAAAPAATSEGASPSPPPLPTAAATATAAAAVTPVSAATAPSSTVASPYERYQYVLTIEFSLGGSSGGDTGPVLLATVEGDYVAPDAHAFTNALEIGGLGFETSAIVIGDEAWSRDGTTGPWAPTSVAALWDDGSADLTSLDPELFIYDVELARQFAALRGTNEVRAGIDTVHYEITPELFGVLASVLSPNALLGFDLSAIDEFGMDVWVDPETSSVVALEMRFLGTAGAFAGAEGLGVPADALLSLVIEFEASQLNDPAITIEAPL